MQLFSEGQACTDSEGGGVGTPDPLPSEKPQIIEFPGKSQSYQASIQYWAIIGQAAKRI